MAKVYIVSGETGEYDSYREWTVCVYGNEARATARVKKLNELLSEHNCWARRADDATKEIIRAHPDGDPHFQTDLTGTTYSYEAVDFIE